MTDRPNIIIQNTPPPAPQSNGLGVAGFVVSLVGFLFCMGVLCPIGLILSACGMRKEPKGLATAGLVLGIIGSMTSAIIIGVFGLGVFTTCASCLGVQSAVSSATQSVATGTAIDSAKRKIDFYYGNHGNMLATDVDGTTEISGLTDGWNHSLRYSRKSATSFEIRSAGRDGRFDTRDDISRVFFEAGTTTIMPGPEQPANQ
jgi:hypothetical protein